MTCIALLVSGAAAAKADPTVSSNAGLASLQAASIIAGLPMCFNLCFYSMAIIRACKMIRGEIKQGHFNPRPKKYPNGMRG